MNRGGGGGGAGGAGSVVTGGPSLNSSISGTSTAYAGGGGAGTWSAAAGNGGGGGAGNGTQGISLRGGDALANTGSGGGGGGGENGPLFRTAGGGDGGSGIVIIRYKTDGSDGIDAATTTGGTKTTSGIYTIHTFTESGTFTVSDSPAAPHRLQIEHASGTGLTCTPSTLTVRACADATCTTPYISGVSGTLQATGGSVTWPASAAFTIASGSSTTKDSRPM